MVTVYRQKNVLRGCQDLFREIVDCGGNDVGIRAKVLLSTIDRIQTKMCTMGALIPHDDALLEREYR